MDRLYITIPKGRNRGLGRNTGQKKDQKTSEQTLFFSSISSPLVLYLMSSDLTSFSVPALLTPAHFSPLGWFLSIYEALLRECSMALASTTSGVSNTIQASLSELHTMASPRHQATTRLPRASPQWVFLTSEKNFPTPLLLYPSWL